MVRIQIGSLVCKFSFRQAFSVLSRIYDACSRVDIHYIYIYQLVILSPPLQ